MKGAPFLLRWNSCISIDAFTASCNHHNHQPINGNLAPSKDWHLSYNHSWKGIGVTPATNWQRDTHSETSIKSKSTTTNRNTSISISIIRTTRRLIWVSVRGLGLGSCMAVSSHARTHQGHITTAQNTFVIVASPTRTRCPLPARSCALFLSRLRPLSAGCHRW